MSERIKRRQFLADALFAGGTVAAAALTARWLSEKPPAPPPTTGPTCSPVQGPTIDGDAVPAMPGFVLAEPGPRRNP